MMSKDEQGKNQSTMSGRNKKFERLLEGALVGKGMAFHHRDWSVNYARKNQGLLREIYEKHGLPPGPIIEQVSLYVHAPGADAPGFGTRLRNINQCDIQLKRAWQRFRQQLDKAVPYNKKQGAPLEPPWRAIGEIQHFVEDWIIRYKFRITSDLVRSLAELFVKRPGKTPVREIAQLSVDAFPDWLPRKSGDSADYWQGVENTVSHLLRRRQNRNS